MVRTGPIKLALIMTVIMGIALGFLYLLERQKIYAALKENSRNLVNQEVFYHQQLGQEWDKNLRHLMTHGNMRLYLKAYSKDYKNIPKVYTEALEKLFTEITLYKSNFIHRISLISVDGQELLATENDKAVKSLKDWYSNDYFREALAGVVNKPFNNQFHVDGEDAFLYKSVPLSVGDKKVALLTFTIVIKDIIEKYRYLLAATNNDQIIAVNATGKILYALDKAALDTKEMDQVLVTMKQSDSKDPILEYKQNVWSFLGNEAQDYYVLFESRGEKITNYLNEEYSKLAIVFFISSIMMIALVFFSTRRYQRQQAKTESDAMMHNQRSKNFSSISNEIRQPLNALVGALVTLEESSPEKHQNNYLDSAKKSATQISELVNVFADFASINSGNFELQPIDFDLRTTLNDIADLMSVEASEKSLTISCSVSQDMPERVSGDATRLRRVLINLISFVIKHAEQGEISFSTKVDARSAAEKLIHIDVAVTGSHINQDTMFDRFKKFTAVDYFSNDDTENDGLGLALATQLVTLMQGEIQINEMAAGSNAFRVSLPLPSIEAKPYVTPQSNLEGKRVLIVGEIESNRQLLSHALSKWGMSGATVEDFARAIKVLREAQKSAEAYHACLIDISLSSLSEKAFELVRNIRQEFDESSLGIIVLTVQGAPGDAKIAQEIGAQAFLTKPMTRNSMKEVLLRIFDSKPNKPTEFITRHTLKESEQTHLVRILVADANESAQKQLENFFDSPHYHVEFAVDKKNLEKAINHNVYDMVFLDTELPDVDVFNYVKKFRQYERDLNKAFNVSTAKFIRLPIVAMAPEASSKMRQSCEKNGLDGLLVTPVTREKLDDIISRHLKT